MDSGRVVCVVVTPPDARLLVASLGCTVEPLIHAPQAVEPARVGGIGVVDDAVLERERAHARLFARIGGRVGAAHARVERRSGTGTLPRRTALVVVFDALTL